MTRGCGGGWQSQEELMVNMNYRYSEGQTQRPPVTVEKRCGSEKAWHCAALDIELMSIVSSSACTLHIAFALIIRSLHTSLLASIRHSAVWMSMDVLSLRATMASTL